MKSHQIRQMFLEFFECNHHKILPSSPIIIKNDPTLMFTNAGMNQFKNIFLGFDNPKYSQIANSQKCLRVSGKHNDLEEVGHDTYHHTMFEMLGNWSFGDYSKEKAIDLAWDFLIKKCELNVDRIYVTVFEGDIDENLDQDKESFNFWTKYLPKERILFGNKKDNFWEMGDIGPCGPCSEVHYDNRSDSELNKISGKDLVNHDHPDVIEIWNLVFMQYNRKKNGELEDLSTVHVDTGMGFERLCMILQGVKSNYDTDVFQPLISKISSISKIDYGLKEDSDIAMRVVSDHVRAVAFSIADGQLPSNVKAGYVIRRILRRAIRYGYTFLNVKQPFIYKLIDTLIKTLGDHYSDLNKQKDLIEDVIRQEEVSFLKTLDSGLKRLDNILQNNSKITGTDVFELYDTYGFPKDLTSLILQEKNIKFDDKEFELEMQKQKNRSKKSSAIDYGEWTIVSNSENEKFVGYEKSISTSQITRYRSVSIKDEIKYHIVLEETPFYPEGGGQVGDSGHLKYADANIEVLDTIKENNLIYHVVNNLPKDIKSKCDAIINENRRKSISRNHTATHLLHLELKNVLGDHVMQKGSLVDENYFRFDFSHHNAISLDLIEKIEQNVNATILKNISLNEKTNVSLSDAEEMGALMLFGEKYDEKVRVIQFGESIELCGGTHVGSTSEIGLFKIVSESSVASGIRRIEARTGISAFNLLNDSYQKSRNLETLFKTKDISSAIDKLLNDNKTLEIKNQKLEKESLSKMIDDLVQESERIGDIYFVNQKLKIDSKNLKEISFILKEKKNIVAIIGVLSDNKINVGLFISNNLVSSDFNAKDLIGMVSEKISGSGGGQSHFAVSGGNKPEGFNDAASQIKNAIINR